MTLDKVKRHNLRLLKDGRWVCSGGVRHGQRDRDGRTTWTGGGCDFASHEYAEAVNHATAYGAVPPDMPREAWA